jgi:hypothetical protein
MKRKFILGLLSLFMFIGNQGLTAQHHPKKHVKVVKKSQGRKTVVIKTHKKYSRSKIIVVKKRNGKLHGILPVGYSTIIYKNNSYHYHNGIYYLPRANAYIQVIPPVGLRIKTLPKHQIIPIGLNNYHYYQGVYYILVNNEYETIDPPVGIMVEDVPVDLVEEITIDGVTYYEFNEYLYKKTNLNTYELVGKLE